MIENDSRKEYLGEGVHVECYSSGTRQYILVYLSALNGQDRNHQIYLEEEVWQRLMEYGLKIGFRHSQGKPQ